MFCINWALLLARVVLTSLEVVDKPIFGLGGSHGIPLVITQPYGEVSHAYRPWLADHVGLDLNLANFRVCVLLRSSTFWPFVQELNMLQTSQTHI